MIIFLLYPWGSDYARAALLCSAASKSRGTFRDVLRLLGWTSIHTDFAFIGVDLSGLKRDWKERFERSSVEALNCLSRKKVPELLALTLERLSVLQEQVIGGGATFNSRVNREQVETGSSLLMTLLPVVLNIMLEHPHEDWGTLAFPVVSN